MSDFRPSPVATPKPSRRAALQLYIRTLRVRVADRVAHIRDTNRFVCADFQAGTHTLRKFVSTHYNKYYRHVGAHFLRELLNEGADVLESFAEKHRDRGWHFELTEAETRALHKARENTCTHTRISRLRYSTNVFETLTNKRQLLRMLGLGAVAGSAGILLGLGELLFFAKEYSKDLLSSTLGLNWQGSSPEDKNAEFVGLAREITSGAVNSDGSLDASVVAGHIETLVTSLQAGGNTEAAVSYMNADISYIFGIFSGIVILIVGRGLVQLVLEGVTGTTTKIDALIRDMDDFCNWQLGRSPFPPEVFRLPGAGPPEAGSPAAPAPPCGPDRQPPAAPPAFRSARAARKTR